MEGGPHAVRQFPRAPIGTVTKSGSIRDPQPVDCQPSGVFESASVKAAMKFKYKPRVVDGEAIEVAGVQNKFTYELEQ